MRALSTLIAALATASLMLFAHAGAAAQTPPDDGYAFPLSYPALDGNGVDSPTGLLQAAVPAISIGDPGAGGLAYTQIYTGTDWRHSIGASIKAVGTTYTVNFLGSAEVFTLSGGMYTPQVAGGSTLTYNSSTGNYTYTLPDGTVAIMNVNVNGLSMNIFGGNVAVVTSVTRPNGDQLTYNYRSVTIVHRINVGTPWEPEYEYQNLGPFTRPQSVVSNRGYQLHFHYERDANPTDWQNHLGPWWTATGVTLLNAAVDYCPPGSTWSACSTTQTWPTLTFTDLSSTVRTYTDTLGRVTRITRNASGNITRLRRPGSASDDVIVNYASGRVSSVAVNGLTTTYAYSDVSGTRTTSIDAPGSAGISKVETNLTTGLVSAVENPAGGRTTYVYDANRRVTRVTAPEGNYTNYTYDSRGNVTLVRQVAKSGSGLADIVTSAAYPASCTNVRTCNQPSSVTDAAGFRTDFTYDATHGGMLTATSPASSGTAPVGSGDRPQTRVTYAPLYAWYKRTSSAIIQAASPVYLPVQSSTCSTGTSPSCINSANEQRVTVSYGATGVANNLVPVSATAQAGNGTLAATTTLAYDNVRNLLTVDGPQSGTADTTRYRYDNARQLIGQVGPDPDDAGALLFPAQRTTYNLNGQATKVEFGTVTSQSDAAWTAFALIDRQEVVYDSAGRASQARLITGTSSVQALIQYSYDNAGRIDCIAQRMNAATWASPPSSACTLATTGSYGPDRISRNTYDTSSRLVTTTSGHGTAAPITQATRAYSPNGQLVSLTDGEDNRTGYRHDGFDRLDRIEYPHPSTPDTSSSTDVETYTYDAVGRLANRQVRTGQQFVYTYDNLGRVTHVNAPAGQADETYSYDLLGRVLSVTAGSRSLGNAYDALGRLTAQTGDDGTVSYQYDSAGRRTRMTWPDAFYVTYSHNVNGAVTAIRENGATSGIGVLASFTYDNQGRRTAITRGNGVTTAYAFDAASRLASLTQDLNGTTADLTTSFTYNPAGQIASRTASNDAYAWNGHVNLDLLYGVNGLNQITSVTGQSAPVYDGLGNMTSYAGDTFGYDYSNRLISVSSSVGLAYDPVGRLVELTGSAATVRFQYDGIDMIAEYNSSGVLQDRYVHGPGTDEPLVHYTGSGTTAREWLIADERGSIVAITSATGAAIATNSYDEYGLPGASNAGRYGYTGQVWLAETGLYHYKNRVYHPGLGRFMQTDPIGQAGGMNIYAYVGGDPVNATDPLGLWICRTPQVPTGPNTYHFWFWDCPPPPREPHMGAEFNGGGGGGGIGEDSGGDGGGACLDGVQVHAPQAQTGPFGGTYYDSAEGAIFAAAVLAQAEQGQAGSSLDGVVVGVQRTEFGGNFGVLNRGFIYSWEYRYYGRFTSSALSTVSSSVRLNPSRAVGLVLSARAYNPRQRTGLGVLSINMSSQTLASLAQFTNAPNIWSVDDDGILHHVYGDACNE